MPKLKIVGLPLVLEPTWSCCCGRPPRTWLMVLLRPRGTWRAANHILAWLLIGRRDTNQGIQIERKLDILGLQKLCLACLAFLINIDSAKWNSKHVTLYFLATGGTCVCIYNTAVYRTNNHPRLLGFSNVNTSSPLLTTICWPLRPTEPTAHSTHCPVQQNLRLK